MKDYKSAFKDIENFAKGINKNESDTTQKDMVKNPSHYQGKYGLEVYEILENFLPDAESYYLGNVIKYILRYKSKNGLEDLKKAREYLNKMIEEYENAY